MKKEKIREREDMETSGMESLLRAREDKLRGELRSDDLIEKNRARSVERLRDAFGDMLLRYNAEHSEERPLQAMADALTATADELFALLQTGSLHTESTRRGIRLGGVFSLLAAVICALAGVLLIEPYRVAGYALFAACALGLFLGGRFWFAERQETVRAGVDADAVWKILCRTAETMDRKLDAFGEQERAWEAELAAAAAPGADSIDPEELQLFADLLEALYSGNGEFSLRQLRRVRGYLQRRGVDVVDYEPAVSTGFETLPTRNETKTLRPALMAGDKLLLAGRAAEHIED